MRGLAAELLSAAVASAAQAHRRAHLIVLVAGTTSEVRWGTSKDMAQMEGIPDRPDRLSNFRGNKTARAVPSVAANDRQCIGKDVAPRDDLEQDPARGLVLACAPVGAVKSL